MSGRPIIHLNVGGTLYTTTKETLTKCEPSGLRKVFNCDVPECPKDKDGNYFIDADGPLFRYILNYLRTVDPMSFNSGFIILPTDFQELRQLEAEAEFYGLTNMVIEIQGHRMYQPPRLNRKPVNRPRFEDSMSV